MKIYLAARLSQAPLLREVAHLLTDAGHTVTSRWLSRPVPSVPSVPSVLLNVAAEDLADIDQAEVLILYTAYGKHFGGARHFEAGYALGRGKRIIVVGPVENVFYAAMEQATTWPGLLDLLGQ